MFLSVPFIFPGTSSPLLSKHTSPFARAHPRIISSFRKWPFSWHTGLVSTSCLFLLSHFYFPDPGQFPLKKLSLSLIQFTLISKWILSILRVDYTIPGANLALASRTMRPPLSAISLRFPPRVGTRSAPLWWVEEEREMGDLDYDCTRIAYESLREGDLSVDNEWLRGKMQMTEYARSFVTRFCLLKARTIRDWETSPPLSHTPREIRIKD